MFTGINELEDMINHLQKELISTCKVVIAIIDKHWTAKEDESLWNCERKE